MRVCAWYYIDLRGVYLFWSGNKSPLLTDCSLNHVSFFIFCTRTKLTGSNK